MRRALRQLSLVTVGLTAPLAAQVSGTPTQVAAPAVQFLAMSARGPVPVEVSAVAVLRRKVSVTFAGVTLEEALAEIEGQANVQFAYSRAQVPLGARITLKAEGMTLAAILTELLLDAGVDVVVSPGQRLALVQHIPVGSPRVTGSVAGRVTDAKTGLGVAGARVTLQGASVGAVTDDNGGFRMTNVPPGTYTVTVRRIGYAQGAGSVAVVADEEAVVDVRLELSASPLDAVVVTGTVVRTEVKALPTPISVIGEEEIREKQIRRVDQLFRGTIPGAISWDLGVDDFYSLVSVRGTSSLSLNYIKTYIDGVEVASPTFIATIDPNSIERVEVVRGPQAATLYGSDAAGGVMQIFTKKGQASALKRPRVELSVAAGPIGSQYAPRQALQQEYGLDLTGGESNVTYHAGGTYTRTGEWLPGYTGAHAGGVSGGLQMTQGAFTAALSGRWADKAFTRTLNPELVTAYPALQPVPARFGVQQQTVGLDLGYAVGPRWEHHLTVGWDRTAQEYFWPRPALRTPDDTLRTVSSASSGKATLRYTTTVRLSHGPATSSLTAGLDHWEYTTNSFYTSTAVRTSGALDARTVSARRDGWGNTGYFAQLQSGFHDALFLTAGLRAEDNPNFGDEYGLALSPRMGLAAVQGLGGVQVKVRAGWGDAIRPPDPLARVGAVQTFGIILPNPQIGPERQRGWDAGLDLFWGARASLGVTYYNQRAIDLIEYVLVDAQSSPPTQQAQNVGEIRNRGWEVQAALNLAPVRLEATYSLTNSRVSKLSPTYSGVLRPGDKNFGIPDWNAGATLTYTLPRGSASLEAIWIGPWIALDWFAYGGYLFGGQPYRGSLRAYFVGYPSVTKLNFRAQHALTGRIGAFLRLENLTNQQDGEVVNLFVTQGRTALLGIRASY